ncbi:MAG: hypothetical protein WA002_07240 [Candidatus Acidiferrales bacterium]
MDRRGVFRHAEALASVAEDLAEVAEDLTVAVVAGIGNRSFGAVPSGT